MRDNVIIFLFLSLFVLLYWYFFIFTFIWWSLFIRFLFFQWGFFQRRKVKSLCCFFQVFFILKMNITDKLLFWKLNNFLLIHTSNMQSFWAPNTLQNRHRISTDTTLITIMKRASEMKRIWVYVLEMLFPCVSFHTFWMEIFWTISSGALGYFIFLLILWSNRYFSLLLFVVVFSFSFFWFLILHAIIVTFFFTDKTSYQIIFTILTCEIYYHGLFQNFIF